MRKAIQTAEAFKSAKGARTSLWDRVVGPAGALLATVRRLGYDMFSATKLKLFDGTEVDLETSGPRTVEKIIDFQVDRWQWEQTYLHFRRRDGVWMGMVKKRGLA